MINQTAKGLQLSAATFVCAPNRLSYCLGIIGSMGLRIWGWLHRWVWWVIVVRAVAGDVEALRITGVEPTYLRQQLQYAWQKTNHAAVPASTADKHQALQESLQPFGFFQPKTRLSRDAEGHWTLQVLTLGTQMRWTDVSMQCQGPGCRQTKVQQVLHDPPIRVGQPFSVQHYQHVLVRVRDALQAQGYLLAVVRPRVQVLPQRQQARLQVWVTTGPCFRWAQVTWQGSRLLPSVLEGFLPDVKGPYNPKVTTTLQSELLRSGYFSTVEVNPNIDQKRHRVSLAVKLQDQRRYARTYGLGYDTDRGWQGLAQMNWPSLNRHGHKFYTQAHVGTRESSFALRYMMPGRNILSDQWIAGFQLRHEDQTDVGLNTSTTLSLEHLMYAKRWQAGVAFKALEERSRPLDRAPYNSWLVFPEARLTRYFSWGKDDVNQLRWQWLARGASAHWLSSVSFSQAETAAQGNIQWTPRWSWLVRMRMGHVLSGNLDDIPLSLQYTTGGSHRLRGYPYGSIGPGLWLLEGSFSNFISLNSSWYVSQFLDVGQASDHWRQPLKQGVGMGVLWLTAVGGIEVSVARPLHDPDYHRWRIHLGVRSRRYFPDRNGLRFDA